MIGQREDRDLLRARGRDRKSHRIDQVRRLEGQPHRVEPAHDRVRAGEPHRDERPPVTHIRAQRVRHRQPDAITVVVQPLLQSAEVTAGERGGLQRPEVDLVDHGGTSGSCGLERCRSTRTRPPEDPVPALLNPRGGECIQLGECRPVAVRDGRRCGGGHHQSDVVRIGIQRKLHDDGFAGSIPMRQCYFMIHGGLAANGRNHRTARACVARSSHGHIGQGGQDSGDKPQPACAGHLHVHMLVADVLAVTRFERLLLVRHAQCVHEECADSACRTR